MKIAIVGAGAIGSLVAARLAASGERVTVIARGGQLAAIRAAGIKLIERDGTTVIEAVDAFAHLAEAGPQDLVILAVKAQQLAPIAAEIGENCGPDALILTAQNGIPWWYFEKHGGPYEGHRLESVDPGGIIAAHLPIDRIIASVVYPAAEVVAPGTIRHIEGERFSLAEIDDAATPRIAAVSQTFQKAGFKAPVASDIRAEIWMKLWGNLSFNPISALTGATLEDIVRFGATRELAAAMMREARDIGEAFGIRFRLSIEKRIAGAEAVGPHKTSMLQDVKAGRPIEIDALLGSVIELGRLAKLATPHLDSVYALAKLLDRGLRSSPPAAAPARG